MSSSRRSVFLHVGAPKTGTTYLQDRLYVNARTLAAHGVHFPTTSPLVSAPLSHFRAALDLLEQDWGGQPGHAKGAWPTLVRQVRRSTGTVVISHEILATAPAEKISRVMNDFSADDVHIIYSARDLARQMPAAWQESIKQGRQWRFRRFLNAAQRREAWFMRAFDLPTVLNSWSRNLPPENVHVLVVPPREAAPGELWRRFCGIVGIEPDWAPLDSERANASLGIAETELLRRLNKRLNASRRRTPEQDALIQKLLLNSDLGTRKSRRVMLPPDRFDWAEEQARLWIDWLQGSGVDVVGEPSDLLPMRPPEGQRWRNPDRASSKNLSRTAVNALAIMTREAAERPNPEAHLGSKLRRQSARLLGR